MEIGYTVANSSLGKVLVAATTRGVSAVYLGERPDGLVDALRKEYPRAEIRRTQEANEQWLREILRRIEGDAPSLDLPLDVHGDGVSVARVAGIAEDSARDARTYTQVAHALGEPRSVRAVPRACATNPVSIVVPCHRVVRADGSLAGYRWGLQRKKELISREANHA